MHYMHYANRDGSLTPEAIGLLNKAAVEAPHEMYPLSQLAADMARAGLLIVRGGGAGTDLAGGTGRSYERWRVCVTEAGWRHVTDPEALTRHRREGALKLLQNATDTEPP